MVHVIVVITIQRENKNQTNAQRKEKGDNIIDNDDKEQ